MAKAAKGTKVELEKYKEYVELMEQHGVKPRDESEWLRTYRDVQSRTKKGGTHAKAAS